MQIVESANELEKKVGQPIKYFAYPGGGYDDVCLEIVEEYYTLGFKDRTNEGNDLDKRKVGRVSIDTKHNNFKSFLIELSCVRYL